MIVDIICRLYINKILSQHTMIKCKEYKNGKGKFEIEIDFTGLSMLESETKIQDSINEVGNMMTEKRLKEFDADGSPIIIGDVKMTTKGLYMGGYETPFGQIEVERHLYQTNNGGKTYCPLNENARIIKKTCTPKLAKTISNKYSNLAAGEVVTDMSENHSRDLTRSYIQDVSEFVGSIVNAKEEEWHYEIPKINDAISTVGISMDGACVLILKDGYREVMTGAITLYNKEGIRMHSLYYAVEPEQGKQRFFNKMKSAINEIKGQFPDALYIGVSDGAKDLWKFLKKHTSEQILDYYHASEYLSEASHGIYPKDEKERKKWLDDAYSSLKHDSYYPTKVISEMKNASRKKLKDAYKEKLESAITYFKNNKSRMKYAENLERNLPIGSGVIEAACKTIVKSRLCRTGMKWKSNGVKIVLSLRAMIKSSGKWNLFWNKINNIGVPVVT